MANTSATGSNRESEEIWVLRVGVVRDRKVVEERLVTFGEPVTIGSLESNLFTLSDLGEGFSGRYELFEFRNGAYYLHFNKHVDGKIQMGEEGKDLSELRDGGSISGQRSVEKRGEHQLSLSELSKGKIEIGEYSFLFQFVSTPAVVVQQKKEVEVAGGLVEDDAIFLSFLGFFGVVAAGLIWWIAIQPKPGLLDQDEVEELLAEYLDLEEVEEEEPTDADEATDEDLDAPVDPNKVDPKKAEPEEVEEKPSEKPTPKETEEVTKKATASANMSDSDRAAAQDAVSKSFLFQAIGTVGEGSGVVTSAFGGEGGENVDLDQVLDGVTDGQMAVNDAQMTVKGAMDKSGKATTKVGVVSAEGKGGSSVAGSGPKVSAPKSVAKIQKIDTAMGECADGINKTVRKYLSQVKTCHDISLKSNPSVAGRVEIEIEIMDGKVSVTNMIKNTTGDSKVGSCIEKKIRRWKFPASCSDIAVLPFALSPKN
jgi:hypothetical protein